MTQLLAQIFGRVRTFKLLNWSYHSQHFNPYKLASLGYISVSRNTIECVICHHQVHISDDQFQLYQQSITQHQKQCIYNDQQPIQIKAEDLYLKMDDINAELKLNLNQQNLSTKTKIAYPLINMEAFFNTIGPNKHTLYKIIQKYQGKTKEIKISFILQLMGWRFIVEATNQIHLQCYFCGRNVKVSNYKCAQTDKQCLTTIQENQSLKISFDCVNQHRYFCLWVENVQGWRVYLQHLWDKLGQSQSLFKRQKPEETKKIRVQMDEYLKSFQIKTKELFQRLNNVMQDCQRLSKHIEGETQDQIEKLNKTRDLMSSFTEQVEENVKNPLKKIKLN